MRGIRACSWTRAAVLGLVCVALAGLVTACGAGGGGGGAGPDGEGQGLVLMAFNANGLDNVPINRRLKITFSEAVNASTVMVTDPADPAYLKGTGSIQIREGSAFGRTAAGTFDVDGSIVWFNPDLPGLCDLSDSGLQAGTTYRVTIQGAPEALAVRNTRGQPLEATRTFEFTTLPESHRDYLEDAVPGETPRTVLTVPEDGSTCVPVEDGNHVRLEFSENLDPCSVNPDTVRLFMSEIGDPDSFLDTGNGTASGFSPIEDGAPSDPYSWGSTLPHTVLAPLQRIPADVTLVQDFDQTVVTLVPRFGRFPENALLVVDLGFGILDFGGYPLIPSTVSFTTENLPEQENTYVVDNEDETPYITSETTADVNTLRSPGLAQGYTLISGDGDNGTQMVNPTAPEVPPDCEDMRDINDGVLDDFAPAVDTVLNTGDSVNTCPNGVDGSNAVVWEFNSFTIQPGVTVSIVGLNPAILLVRGEVTIHSGGTLDLAGSVGLNGVTTTYPGTRPASSNGGSGVAGGGDGGASLRCLANEGESFPIPIPYTDSLDSYGEDGWEGIGSPDYPGQGTHGGGEGNAGSWHGALASPTGPYESSSFGAGGGGAGHALEGGTGGANTSPSGNSPLSAPARGGGGDPYPEHDAAMYMPSAGSGGGAGGYFAFPSYTNSYAFWAAAAGGGGGGAGGGFVDITSSFDINIHGTIDARGGRGGTGGSSYFCDTSGGGGGGGGSGGGIRLLTSGNIDVSGATITTAGGSGGSAGGPTTCPQGTAGAANPGGAGSHGRIALEDDDGVITGQATATMVPMEGGDGFYRNQFDPGRFLGGGRTTTAVSDLFLVGAFDPEFSDPPESDPGDFLAGIPAVASGDPGETQVLVEAQGYQMLRDGTPDLASATGWRTVGYFTNTGSPTEPRWNLGQAYAFPLPLDNVDPWGITNLDGCEYIQVRFTFELGPRAAIEDAGPFIDQWIIRFVHDQ